MGTVHVMFVKDQGAAGRGDVVFRRVVLRGDGRTRGVVAVERVKIAVRDVYWWEIRVAGVGGVLEGAVVGRGVGEMGRGLREGVEVV